MSDAFKAWQEEHTPDRKEVPVCFDRKLLHAYEAASHNVAINRDHQSLKMLEGKSPELLAAEKALEEATAAVRAAQKTLVFESIGTKRWRDLMSEHPPVGDQRQVVTLMGIPLQFNPDTFVPVALAACCVDPGMTIEQAEWFCAEFPVSEVDRVFGAVLTCNVTGLERPFDDIDSLLPGARN